jgi:hypothetical protein
LLRRLLFVTFFLEVGLLLIILPWSSSWGQNYFAYASPGLRTFLSDYFVRGAVSGLGFINLFAAFAELAPVFSARERRHLLLRGESSADH